MIVANFVILNLTQWNFTIDPRTASRGVGNQSENFDSQIRASSNAITSHNLNHFSLEDVLRINIQSSLMPRETYLANQNFEDIQLIDVLNYNGDNLSNNKVNFASGKVILKFNIRQGNNLPTVLNVQLKVCVTFDHVSKDASKAIKRLAFVFQAPITFEFTLGRLILDAYSLINQNEVRQRNCTILDTLSTNQSEDKYSYLSNLESPNLSFSGMNALYNKNYQIYIRTFNIFSGNEEQPDWHSLDFADSAIMQANYLTLRSPIYCIDPTKISTNGTETIQISIGNPKYNSYLTVPQTIYENFAAESETNLIQSFLTSDDIIALLTTFPPIVANLVANPSSTNTPLGHQTPDESCYRIPTMPLGESIFVHDFSLKGDFFQNYPLYLNPLNEHYVLDDNDHLITIPSSCCSSSHNDNNSSERSSLPMPNKNITLIVAVRKNAQFSPQDILLPVLQLSPLTLILQLSTLVVNDTQYTLYLFCAQSSHVFPIPAMHCISLNLEDKSLVEGQNIMDCAFYKIGIKNETTESHKDDRAEDEIYFSGSLMVSLKRGEEDAYDPSIKGVLLEHGVTHLEILFEHDQILQLTVQSSTIDSGTRLISIKDRYRFVFPLQHPSQLLDSDGHKVQDALHECPSKHSPYAMQAISSAIMPKPFDYVIEYTLFRSNSTLMFGNQTRYTNKSLLSNAIFCTINRKDLTNAMGIVYINKCLESDHYINTTCHDYFIDIVFRFQKSQQVDCSKNSTTTFIIRVQNLTNTQYNDRNYADEDSNNTSTFSRIQCYKSKFTNHDRASIFVTGHESILIKRTFALPFKIQPENCLGEALSSIDSFHNLQKLCNNLNIFSLITSNQPFNNDEELQNLTSTTKPKGSIQYFSLVRQPIIPYVFANTISSRSLLLFHSYSININPENFDPFTNIDDVDFPYIIPCIDPLTLSLIKSNTKSTNVKAPSKKPNAKFFQLTCIPESTVIGFEPLLSSHRNDLNHDDYNSIVKDAKLDERDFLWFGVLENTDDCMQIAWTKDPLIVSSTNQQTLPINKRSHTLELHPFACTSKILPLKTSSKEIQSITINIEFHYPSIYCILKQTPDIAEPQSTIKVTSPKIFENTSETQLNILLNNVDVSFCQLGYMPIASSKLPCLKEIAILHLNQFQALCAMTRTLSSNYSLSQHAFDLAVNGVTLQNAIISNLPKQIIRLGQDSNNLQLLSSDKSNMVSDESSLAELVGNLNGSCDQCFDFPIVFQTLSQANNTINNDDPKSYVEHHDVSLKSLLYHFEYQPYLINMQRSSNSSLPLAPMASHFYICRSLDLNVPSTLRLYFEDKYWLHVLNNYVPAYWPFSFATSMTNSYTHYIQTPTNSSQNISVTPFYFNINSLLLREFQISDLNLKVTLRFHYGNLFVSSSSSCNTPMTLPLLKITKGHYELALDLSPFGIGMTSLFTALCTKLAGYVVKRYTSDIYKNAAWIIGSLDLIGSPAILVNSLKDAFMREFYAPSNKSTTAYETTANTVTSSIYRIDQVPTKLFRILTSSIFVSLANFCDGLSRNLDLISFDSEHVHYKSQRRLQKRLSDSIEFSHNNMFSANKTLLASSNSSTSTINLTTINKMRKDMVYGVSGLGFSLIAAIAGIIDVPLKEFQAYLYASPPSSIHPSMSSQLLVRSNIHNRGTRLYSADDMALQTNANRMASTSLTKTLIVGIGKGLIGAVVKPLGGVSEFVASSAHSLLSLIGASVNENSDFVLRKPIIYILEDQEGMFHKIANLWITLLNSSTSTKIRTQGCYLFKINDVLTATKQKNDAEDTNNNNSSNHYFGVVVYSNHCTNIIENCHNSGHLYVFQCPEPGMHPSQIYNLYELRVNGGQSSSNNFVETKDLTDISYDNTENICNDRHLLTILAFDENAYVKRCSNFASDPVTQTIIHELKTQNESPRLKGLLRNAYMANNLEVTPNLIGADQPDIPYSPICELELSSFDIDFIFNILKEAITSDLF